MFRGILYLILITVAISVIKAVIGIVSKAAFGNTSSDTGAPRPRSSSRPSSVGELRKDPVCGTFVSTATALQTKAGGEMYYFCSTTCRDKFKS